VYRLTDSVSIVSVDLPTQFKQLATDEVLHVLFKAASFVMVNSHENPTHPRRYFELKEHNNSI
jgi:hypothetical protein